MYNPIGRRIAYIDTNDVMQYAGVCTEMRINNNECELTIQQYDEEGKSL